MLSNTSKDINGSHCLWRNPTRLTQNIWDVEMQKRAQNEVQVETRQELRPNLPVLWISNKVIKCNRKEGHW